MHVPVIEDPDQYSTDFTKCLKFLRDWQSQRVESHTDGDDGSRTLDVLILGGLGGRVDQAFSQIHHLSAFDAKWGRSAHAENDKLSLNLYLVSEESITFILHPGRNIIHTPGTNRPDASSSKTSKDEEKDSERAYYLEENVGIIPFLGPTKITTHGFEWDVTHWPTQIGKQISTSNHIRADVVEVDCEESVLFTLELATRLKLWERH